MYTSSQLYQIQSSHHHHHYYSTWDNLYPCPCPSKCEMTCLDLNLSAYSYGKGHGQEKGNRGSAESECWVLREFTCICTTMLCIQKSPFWTSFLLHSFLWLAVACTATFCNNSVSAYPRLQLCLFAPNYQSCHPKEGRRPLNNDSRVLLYYLLYVGR